MPTLRVLLVDDHALLRAGLRSLLSEIADIEVVGEAADGHEALKLIAQTQPDIALLDITMPGLNGLEVTARVTKLRSPTRILILSMHSSPEHVRQAFALGAAGYLLKDAAVAELEAAVRAVAAGATWLSPSLVGAVPDARGAARGTPAQPNPPGPFELLTSRQREILQLIAEGHSTRAIAHRLALSIKTVETHRARVMERLAIDTTQGLVRCAIRAGLVSPSP